MVILVREGFLGTLRSKGKTGEISENRTGNIAKRRLFVNPYGPEIQTEFCCFLGENDLNSEKGGIYESRYVPNSSAEKKTKSSLICEETVNKVSNGTACGQLVLGDLGRDFKPSPSQLRFQVRAHGK